jgi:hypothetical protein
MLADALEVGIAHLEGAYEQIDRRLGAVERRIAALDRKIDDGFAHVRTEIQSVRGELLGRLDHQFFWILGLLIISILVTIVFRLTGR